MSMNGSNIRSIINTHHQHCHKGTIHDINLYVGESSKKYLQLLQIIQKYHYIFIIFSQNKISIMHLILTINHIVYCNFTFLNYIQ